jgi:hypothetical protein
MGVVPIDEKQEADLGKLFEQARREQLWFYSLYQSLWFSPDELLVRWGVVNWQLRDPKERVEEIDRKITALQEERETFLVRVAMSRE